jgi:hypothetical protein
LLKTIFTKTNHSAFCKLDGVERPTAHSRDDTATEQLSNLLRELSEGGHLARLLDAARHQVTSLSNQPARALAGDVLHGADGIAEFLYGDKRLRRKVYNLVETARLPHFRLGTIICARRSVLLAWIEEQERAKKSASTVAIDETGRA